MSHDDATPIPQDLGAGAPLSRGSKPAGAPRAGSHALRLRRGVACHGGRERLMAATDAAGRSEVLDQLMAGLPPGAPRPAPVHVPRLRAPSGWASGCAAPPRSSPAPPACVYGLTFTSHFYGARRTVGYVPFNSESLVTGQLFRGTSGTPCTSWRTRSSTTPS